MKRQTRGLARVLGRSRLSWAHGSLLCAVLVWIVGCGSCPPGDSNCTKPPERQGTIKLAPQACGTAIEIPVEGLSSPNVDALRLRDLAGAKNQTIYIEPRSAIEIDIENWSGQSGDRAFYQIKNESPELLLKGNCSGGNCSQFSTRGKGPIFPDGSEFRVGIRKKDKTRLYTPWVTVAYLEFSRVKGSARLGDLTLKESITCENVNLRVDVRVDGRFKSTKVIDEIRGGHIKVDLPAESKCGTTDAEVIWNFDKPQEYRQPKKISLDSSSVTFPDRCWQQVRMVNEKVGRKRVCYDVDLASRCFQEKQWELKRIDGLDKRIRNRIRNPEKSTTLEKLCYARPGDGGTLTFTYGHTDCPDKEERKGKRFSVNRTKAKPQCDDPGYFDVGSLKTWIQDGRPTDRPKHKKEKDITPRNWAAFKLTPPSGEENKCQWRYQINEGHPKLHDPKKPPKLRCADRLTMLLYRNGKRSRQVQDTRLSEHCKRVIPPEKKCKDSIQNARKAYSRTREYPCCGLVLECVERPNHRACKFRITAAKSGLSFEATVNLTKRRFKLTDHSTGRLILRKNRDDVCTVRTLSIK